MNNIFYSKTTVRKTNIALLLVFFLFAFIGKSYAWHFGPETDASNWEYEKNFGITISQKTSMDSELAAVSKVQGTHVEIKDENDGLLPAASGNLVSRKIQTLKTIQTNDEFIIKFKYYTEKNTKQKQAGSYSSYRSQREEFVSKDISESLFDGIK